MRSAIASLDDLFLTLDVLISSLTQFRPSDISQFPVNSNKLCFKNFIKNCGTMHTIYLIHAKFRIRISLCRVGQYSTLYVLNYCTKLSVPQQYPLPLQMQEFSAPRENR